jgi:hypothetical protein
MALVDSPCDPVDTWKLWFTAIVQNPKKGPEHICYLRIRSKFNSFY